MVAKLDKQPFDREGWLFELKWEGFRTITELDALVKSSSCACLSMYFPST